MQPLKRIEAIFFKTERGAEPVREWLKSLPVAERKIIGNDIGTLEFGWPIGMPLCRPLGKGVHEVRSKLPTRIARIVFYVDGDRMVLLHGFIKKDQKTPKPDLDLAIERKRIREQAK